MTAKRDQSRLANALLRERNTLTSFARSMGSPAPLVIVIVKSQVDGRWGYCPKGTLERIISLTEGAYRSANAAIAAARADNTVPMGATFEVQE